MHDYQIAFIEFAIARQALKFGNFTLKSGRQSPYFFNAGCFNTGNDLVQLGDCYAKALIRNGLDIDLVFGPAYKGIPLAAATAMALAKDYQRDLPFAFNRKEAKTHGEGGNIVGAPLAGRVLLVDDVITAGTAIRESMTLIQSAGAQPAGVLIALDRQERGQGKLSAIQEVEADFSIPVISIINLTQLLTFVREHPALKSHAPQIKAYQAAYGV